MAGTAVSSVNPIVPFSSPSEISQILAPLLNLIVDDLELLRANSGTGALTLLAELAAQHAVIKTLTDELKSDFNALRADVTAVRSAVTGITAKLDADGGVTDTNYAATLNPAALTSTDVAAAAASALAATVPDPEDVAAEELLAHKLQSSDDVEL